MEYYPELLSDEEILFSVETPLGFRVRTTVSYWTIITTIKHPVMVGREADVEATLRAPDEVRLSQTDEKGQSWDCHAKRQQCDPQCG